SEAPSGARPGARPRGRSTPASLSSRSANTIALIRSGTSGPPSTRHPVGVRRTTPIPAASAIAVSWGLILSPNSTLPVLVTIHTCGGPAVVGTGVPEGGGPRSWTAAAPGKGSKDRPRPVLRQLGQLLLHLIERRDGHRRSVGKGQRRDRLVPTVDLHHEVRSLRILHDVHLGARDPFTGQLAFEPLAVPAPGGGVHRELLGAAVRHLAHVFLVCDRGFGRSPFSTPGGSNRFP